MRTISIVLATLDAVAAVAMTVLFIMRGDPLDLLLAGVNAAAMLLMIQTARRYA